MHSFRWNRTETVPITEANRDLRDRLLQLERSIRSRTAMAWATPGNGLGENWRQECLARLGRETVANTGRDPGLRLGNPRAAFAWQGCYAALAQLERVDAGLAEQVLLLVSEVVLFDAADFSSTASLYAHRAVWMNPRDHWTTVHYLDTLLRESGHVLLMLLQVEGRILENSSERMASPLPGGSATMAGVFRALFALDRTCNGLEKYLAVPDISDRATALQLLADDHHRFHEVWPEFLQRARPTKLGARILQGLSLPPRWPRLIVPAE